MMPPLPILRDALSVTPLENGRVAVTVELPAELLRDYCQLLEALSGFFHVAKRRAVFAHAEQRAASLAADQQITRVRQAYRDRLAASFDSYAALGLSRLEAVKRVAADLRAESHPWAYVDPVRSELVAAGRVGQPRVVIKSVLNPSSQTKRP